MIGATTVIPSLQAFCVFASIAVMFDFALQVTVFIGAVVLLDDKAAKGTVVADAHQQEDGETSAEPAPAQPSTRPPTKMQMFFGDRLPTAILSRRGKMAVICVTMAIVSACAVGCTRQEMAFHYDWFVPDSTDVKVTMRERDQHFGGMYLPVVMVSKEADYFDRRADYKGLTDAFNANPNIIASNSWYDAFLASPNSTAAIAGGRAAFFAAVDDFFHTSDGRRYASNVKLNADKSAIVAARVPAFFKGLPG